MNYFYETFVLLFVILHDSPVLVLIDGKVLKIPKVIQVWNDVNDENFSFLGVLFLSGVCFYGNEASAARGHR